MDKMYMRLARQAADQSFDHADQFDENSSPPSKRSRMPSNFYGDDIIPDDSFDSGRKSKPKTSSLKPQTLQALDIIASLKEESNGFLDTRNQKNSQFSFEFVSVDSSLEVSAPINGSSNQVILLNSQPEDPEVGSKQLETHRDHVMDSSFASVDANSEIKSPDKENEAVASVSQSPILNDCQIKENEKIAELEKKLHLERQKVYKLRKILEKSVPSLSADTTTLGNGISIPTVTLDRIRDGWKMRPAFFLRRLMEDTKIFSLEEIAACSVKGKSASTGPEVPRPALDPIRFLTLKNFVINECKLEKDSGPIVKFEESVSRICSDARKRLKDAKLRMQLTPIPQNRSNDTDNEWS